MIHTMQRLCRAAARVAVSTVKRPLDDITVDFVVAGTQKGGTGALDAYLGMHPQICMATAKEVHFFDHEIKSRFGFLKYRFYHSSFDPRPEHKVIGESTPIYMYWWDAPRRIWKYNPKMKIVVLLRNPVDRAFSHWNMERDRGADTMPFWDAIQGERDRCREASPYQHRVFSYVDRGFYVEQLRRMWHFFPMEQVLVLKNEDLRNHPNETLQQVAAFLGVDGFAHVEPIDVHSRPYVSKMSTREREYLMDVYRCDVRNLQRMLNWDCSDWLDDVPNEA